MSFMTRLITIRINRDRVRDKIPEIIDTLLDRNLEDGDKDYALARLVDNAFTFGGAVGRFIEARDFDLARSLAGLLREGFELARDELLSQLSTLLEEQLVDQGLDDSVIEFIQSVLFSEDLE